MPRGIFLTSERSKIEHYRADKPRDLWDSEYATPTEREGDCLVSPARYGRPVEVWKAALTRGRGFTFDLGIETVTERRSWRRYAPETNHERRTRANDTARAALVRWARTESSAAREAFVEAAAESVQYRRLMMRYGLDGNDPMSFSEIAGHENVRWETVRDSVSAAAASLPVLSTAVEHAGLRAVAVQTVRMAEEAMFAEDIDLEAGGDFADYDTSTIYTKRGKDVVVDDAELESLYAFADEIGGVEGEALLSGLQSNWRGPGEWDLAHAQDAVRSRHDFGTVIEVYKSGTSWASDANGRTSLMDAYTDGWAAFFDGANSHACPFRNRKLRKKWHQGYREAAKELAARREGGISTS